MFIVSHWMLFARKNKYYYYDWYYCLKSLKRLQNCLSFWRERMVFHRGFYFCFILCIYTFLDLLIWTVCVCSLVWEGFANIMTNDTIGQWSCHLNTKLNEAQLHTPHFGNWNLEIGDLCVCVCTHKTRLCYRDCRTVWSIVSLVNAVHRLHIGHRLNWFLRLHICINGI